MSVHETAPGDTVHASTVAIGGRGVMIFGPSGAGKSDLALRLIDRGAELVSDDYTALTRDADRLVASPPPTIAGRIEVRGLGIVDHPHRADAVVALAVTLGTEAQRMPEARRREVAGLALPEVVIDPAFASAPIKVELALKAWGA
jgi:serine kinase of HPr protein (carbohydrate metabolism regulator)